MASAIPVHTPNPQVVYLASMVRSVVALHTLIDNKEGRVWRERSAAEEKAQAAKDATAAKAAAAKEGGDAAAGDVNGKPPAADGKPDGK